MSHLPRRAVESSRLALGVGLALDFANCQLLIANGYLFFAIYLIHDYYSYNPLKTKQIFPIDFSPSIPLAWALPPGAAGSVFVRGPVLFFDNLIRVRSRGFAAKPGFVFAVRCVLCALRGKCFSLALRKRFCSALQLTPTLYEPSD